MDTLPGPRTVLQGQHSVLEGGVGKGEEGGKRDGLVHCYHVCFGKVEAYDCRGAVKALVVPTLLTPS
jgi:hypothetical protein